MGKPAASDRLQRALSNPGSTFARPSEVLGDEELSKREKIEILCRWAYDAAELAVADEEGMGGGEPSNLSEVLAALNEVGGACAYRASSPTKHHVACALDRASG
ncbi:MAG: hypothetical protein ACRED8_11265 [Caulobacteraceae bacterium]